MNWKMLVAGLVPIIALVAVLANGFGKDPKALPSMLDGKPAPGFILYDLDGQQVTLEQFAGSPVVINFWATWCRPCAVEHPILLQSAEMYGPRGVQFLGVVYGDTEEKVRPYLKRHGSSYPALLDPGQRTAIDYGVGGVPETFFLSREHIIVRKHAGPLSFNIISEVLEELL